MLLVQVPETELRPALEHCTRLVVTAEEVRGAHISLALSLSFLHARSPHLLPSQPPPHLLPLPRCALQNRRKSDHNALAARAALDEANEERRHLERLLERQRSDAQLQLEAAEQKFEERTKALRRRFEDVEQQREASAAALARTQKPLALSGANAASAAGSSQISDAYVDSADLALFFVLRSSFFVLRS